MLGSREFFERDEHMWEVEREARRDPVLLDMAEADPPEIFDPTLDAGILPPVDTNTVWGRAATVAFDEFDRAVAAQRARGATT